MPAIYDYKGYKLVVRDIQAPAAAVFQSGSKSREGALYNAPTLDLAMKWVDAYLAGYQWAIESKLSVEG